MAGPAILKIDIVSDFKGKGFNQADKDLATLAKTANIAALAIGGALVAGSIKAVGAAEKGATANARLAQVLSQTAGASDEVVSAVQDQAKELAQAHRHRRRRDQGRAGHPRHVQIGRPVRGRGRRRVRPGHHRRRGPRRRRVRVRGVERHRARQGAGGPGEGPRPRSPAPG